MRTLILKNYSTTDSWGQLMLDSFTANLQRHEMQAMIEVCEACEGHELPDFARYDLVVLTGGKFDLTSALVPWVSDILDCIREVSKENSSVKMLGICWGHQAMHLALGGELGMVPGGPKVGVEDIQLTPKGQAFFGQRQTYALPKYHKRLVTMPAPGFTCLAENNEIFVSDSGRLLTFQSHPELTPSIAQNIMATDDGTYAFKSDGSLRNADAAHDGKKVWAKIMEWAA